MKFLVFIFGAYIVLLTSIPCMEIGEYNDRVKTTLFNLPGDHQHNDETCSPFCNCTCCGHIFAPYFQLSKIAVVKPPAKQKQQLFYTDISLPSDFYGNIWQPPKFS